MTFLKVVSVDLWKLKRDWDGLETENGVTKWRKVQSTNCICLDGEIRDKILAGLVGQRNMLLF